VPFELQTFILADVDENSNSKIVKRIERNQKFKLTYNSEIILSRYGNVWAKIVCFYNLPI